MNKTAYKSSKSSSSNGTPAGYSAPQGGQYKDRNLAAMSPEAAQEALKPTDAEPVRLQARMAGCS